MRGPSPLHRLWESLAEPEADKDAVFGQYLFAPQRDDTPEPKEPNKKAEEALLAAANDWVGSSLDRAELEKWAPKLLRLMAKHQYLPILDPGSVPVYRALSFGSDVQKFFSVFGFYPEWGEFRLVQEPGTLQHLDKTKRLQSWTTDIDVALSFASLHKFNITAVCRAQTAGNTFFGKPGVFPVIDHPDDFGTEMETLSFGPVKYDSFFYCCPYGVNGEPEQRRELVKELTK